jgi:hypothetical protein
MKPSVHIGLGAGLGMLIYQFTHSWELTIVSAITEIFWDIDHLVEYFLYCNRVQNFRAFLNSYDRIQWPRMMFILHSYEIIIFLLILSAIQRNMFLWGITIGAAIHLLTDEIGNRLPHLSCKLYPWFYFLSYRAAKRFISKRLTLYT